MEKVMYTTSQINMMSLFTLVTAMVFPKQHQVGFLNKRAFFRENDFVCKFPSFPSKKIKKGKKLKTHWFARNLRFEMLGNKNLQNFYSCQIDEFFLAFAFFYLVQCLLICLDGTVCEKMKNLLSPKKSVKSPLK